MEQWSILSNMLNYIQYDRHLSNHHNLGISAVNRCKINLDMKEERDTMELDFASIPNILKKNILTYMEEFHQI